MHVPVATADPDAFRSRGLGVALIRQILPLSGCFEVFHNFISIFIGQRALLAVCAIGAADGLQLGLIIQPQLLTPVKPAGVAFLEEG